MTGRGLVVFGLLFASTAGANDKADRVFLNGAVWTGNPGKPRAEALAVRGPRILAVGSSSEIRKRAEKGTDIVDLKGAFVVPGFVDAERRLFEGSLLSTQLDVSGCASAAQLQERLGAFARARPDAAWILGFGYAELPEKPRRLELDGVVAERPVLLRGRGVALANSRALERAALTRLIPDPEGGVIERGGSGEPTGLLLGTAASLVARHVPPVSLDERTAAARKALSRAAAAGLTTIHEMAADDDDIAMLLKLEREGALALRVLVALEMKKAPTRDELAVQASQRGLPSRWVSADAVRATLDGWSVPQIEETVLAYDREGWRVILHADAERTVTAAVDAIEKAARAHATKDRRHRLEGLALATPQDLRRLRPLGVAASTRPGALAVDESGAVHALGTGWPDGPSAVLEAIAEAASAGLGVEAALRHFTRDGAWAARQESDKGTLEPGRLGDFIVLSEDILTLEPAALAKVRVLRTVVGGNDAFVER